MNEDLFLERLKRKNKRLKVEAERIIDNYLESLNQTPSYDKKHPYNKIIKIKNPTKKNTWVWFIYTKDFNFFRVEANPFNIKLFRFDDADSMTNLFRLGNIIFNYQNQKMSVGNIPTSLVLLCLYDYFYFDGLCQIIDEHDV